jgi:tetratricopeptide (TPR) repeat protein
MIESAPERLSRVAATAAEPPSLAARPWLVGLVMLALALAVYLPAALRAQFLAFDDTFFFGPQNPEFRDGLAAVLDPTRPIANAWLPVAHLSLWLEWRLVGAAPFVPHLVALVLHGVVAALWVRLFVALRVPAVVAMVAGAWFVVHPALAESVAWVASRKDLLSGLFTALALLVTARCGERCTAARLAALALTTALAMYAKATAVVLPLLALLVCLRIGGARRRFLAPVWIAAVALPIAWHHQLLAAAEGTLVAGSVVDRLPQVPGALGHYLQTAAWPLHLNVLYPEVATLARFAAAAPATWLLLAGAAALALVAALCERWRAVAFGLAWFFAALLPFNTAWPASSIAAADRYLYLALPGFALAAVALVHGALGRAGIALAAAVVLPLAWLGGGRAHAFGDDATLWRSSLAAEPANAVAHLNLVYDLLQRGPVRPEDVRPHLNAAAAAAGYPIHELRARLLLTRLDLMAADYPAAAAQARAAIAAAEAQRARETSAKRSAEAQRLVSEAHLAALEPLRLLGDEAAVAASLRAAQVVLPDDPAVVAAVSMQELQAALARRRAQGATTLVDDDAAATAAEARLAQVLAVHAGHAGLWCARAAWDHARDRVLPALRHYRKAQAADPDCIEAWLGAARLMRQRENHAEAEAYARAGLQRRPDPSLRQELALALVGQGRLDDAIAHLEAYLRVRPDDAEAAKVLANVLVGRAYARFDDADADRADILRIVTQALHHNPKEAKAHLVLGRLAREQRQFAKAVEHFETAHRVLPSYDEARELLCESLADLGYDRMLRRDEEAAAVAWVRCLEVAPKDAPLDAVRMQLQALWRTFEARGIERFRAGDRAGAAADLRRCLQIDPDQHWIAWLLATALHEEPGVDLVELERLCRQAVAWQQRHGLDRSQQVLLLAQTLGRRGDAVAARAMADSYLQAPDPDAKPQVLAALRKLAGG